MELKSSYEGRFFNSYKLYHYFDKGVNMASVSFGTFTKRRNSTKQPSNLSDVRTVVLKESCSQDKPVFIVTGNDFDYNYCMWNNKYYFIDEIISLKNNLIEVRCVLDPLATYKSEILASTQYVSYSSTSGGTWLQDTRIPVCKNATVATSSASMSSLFNTNGFYVLSVVGKNGCDLWAADYNHLSQLLDRVNDWSDDIINDVLGGNYPWSGSGQAATYDFTTVETALESFSKMNMLTGVVGNAYSAAPSCIRSCIWVPFFASPYTSGSGEICLGQFKSGVTTFKCKSTPATGSVSVSIPWQYSDWRRSACEEVYLYLPLVGMISIPSDEIINESAISIQWSATATDGCIAYRVTAGNQIIGTFGANASVNHPIGISQQASAGEIVQTAFAGAEKTINAAINSSLSPISAAASGVGIAMEGVQAAYDIMNVSMSRHNSCIGGIGGGSGTGLSLSATCFTVKHPTVVEPSDMQATMGLPTMKPLALSGLSGFCQCANAHIDAPATAGELDAIDYYLNSGLFIE